MNEVIINKRPFGFTARIKTKTSGNWYSCCLIFYDEPTEEHVISLWKTQRSSFLKVKAK